MATNPLFIFVAAVLPAFLLFAFIYWKDKYQREPIGQLLLGFFFGILSCFLSLSISQPLKFLGFFPDEPTTIYGAIASAFFGAGIPEEGAKLLMLWLLVNRNKYFDEHFDGIVYAATIGLGFAAFENILYLVSNIDTWQTVATARAMFSVPGHFFFAVIMGYFFSLAYFGKGGWRQYARAFYLPVLLHTTYDALLFVCRVFADNQAIQALLLILFYVFFIKMWLQVRRRMSMHLDKDLQTIAEHGSFKVNLPENPAAPQPMPTSDSADITPSLDPSQDTHPTLKPITYNEQDYMPQPTDAVTNNPSTKLTDEE